MASAEHEPIMGVWGEGQSVARSPVDLSLCTNGQRDAHRNMNVGHLPPLPAHLPPEILHLRRTAGSRGRGQAGEAPLKLKVFWMSNGAGKFSPFSQI